MDTEPAKMEQRMKRQTRFKFTQVGAKVYAVCARVTNALSLQRADQQLNGDRSETQVVRNELWSIDLPTLMWTCHSSSSSTDSINSSNLLRLPRPLPKMAVCGSEQTLWTVYREQRQQQAVHSSAQQVTGGEVFGYRVPLTMPSLQTMLRMAFLPGHQNWVEPTE